MGFDLHEQIREATGTQTVQETIEEVEEEARRAEEEAQEAEDRRRREPTSRPGTGNGKTDTDTTTDEQAEQEAQQEQQEAGQLDPDRGFMEQIRERAGVHTVQEKIRDVADEARGEDQPGRRPGTERTPDDTALTDDEREELRELAEEEDVPEPETEEQYETLRQLRDIREMEEDGFTPEERRAAQQGQLRIEEADQIDEAREVEEELAEEERSIEEQLEELEDMPRGSRVTMMVEEDGELREVELTRAEALELLREQRDEIREAQEETEGFITAQQERIDILDRTMDVRRETDPLGGVTTETLLEDAGPREQFLTAVGAGTTAGFDILGEAVTGGDPSEIVEQQVEDIRTGDMGVVDAMRRSLTQSPAVIGVGSVLAGAGAARGIQMAGSVSGTLGTAARTGAAAGGAALVGLEGYRATEDVQEGRTGQAAGRFMRLGLSIAGTGAGARAMQPRITGQDQTTTVGRAVFQRGDGGVLRGAATGGVRTTQTVQHPRLLKSPEEVTRAFMTRVDMKPIKAADGEAVGRGAAQTYRVTDGGRQAIGERRAFLFETAARDAPRSALPFTQRLPARMVGTRVTDPFTGQQTDVASMVMPVSKVRQAGVGTQQQAVTFGTADGRGFQGMQRTTVLDRGATPGVHRTGGQHARQTGDSPDLDLQQLTRTIAQIYGDVPAQASGRTGTVTGAAPDTQTAADTDTDTMTATTRDRDTDTDTDTAATMTRPDRQLSIEEIQTPATDGRTRTQRRGRERTQTQPGRQVDTQPMADMDVGRTTAPGQAERQVPSHAQTLESLAVQRITDRIGPRVTTPQRPGTTRPGALAAFRFDTGDDPEPLTVTREDRDGRREHRDEFIPDIDVISAGLAQFEAGQATVPGDPEVVEQFRRRRDHIGPLATLPAEEVRTGQVERPQTFEPDDDRRYF